MILLLCNENFGWNGINQRTHAFGSRCKSDCYQVAPGRKTTRCRIVYDRFGPLIDESQVGVRYGVSRCSRRRHIRGAIDGWTITLYTRIKKFDAKPLSLVFRRLSHCGIAWMCVMVRVPPSVIWMAQICCKYETCLSWAWCTKTTATIMPGSYTSTDLSKFNPSSACSSLYEPHHTAKHYILWYKVRALKSAHTVLAWSIRTQGCPWRR